MAEDTETKGIKSKNMEDHVVFIANKPFMKSE